MVTSPPRKQRVGQVKTLESSLKTVSAVNPFTASVNLPKTPLFGTDGIRGKAGELLTPSLALQVGFWAGQVLKESAPNFGPVIIGQDSRNSSDMLATAMTAGLTTVGLEVWNLGLCPTPCVAYLTQATNAIGGVMISASHNPPEDNGIKFFGNDGMKLSMSLQNEIESSLRGFNGEGEIAGIWGKHHYRPSLVQEYVAALQRSLPQNLNLQGLRIVLDLAWGACVQLAPSVFKALGAEVICLHDQANGDRINVGCGSTHMDVLQAAIREYNADMGFAFDGDADRVIAVDSQGRIIDGDYILYFWGRTLKEIGQLPDNLIVATVMANLGFERAWEQLGGKLVRTAVGDQYVQAEMWRTGAMLGGEQSGHIICHHYGVSGDGLQTALHLAALVKQSGESLAQLVDESFHTYPQLLHNVRVEDRERRTHWYECDAIQTAIAEAETSMGDRGRVLVRASGTEPVVRVMVEAAEAELAHYWTEQLAQCVQEHLAD